MELSDLRETTRDLMKADGSRPRDEARLGRGRSPQHRPSAHPYPRSRRHRRRQDSQHRRRLHRPRHPRAGRARSSPWSWAARPSRKSPASLSARSDADRFTRLDRMLIAEQQQSNEFADLRPDKDMADTCAQNRALLIDRARKLERMGLATEVDAGTLDRIARRGADAARAWRARRHHQDHAPGAGARRHRRATRHPSRYVLHREKLDRARRRPRARQGPGRRRDGRARPSGDRRRGRARPPCRDWTPPAPRRSAAA